MTKESSGANNLTPNANKLFLSQLSQQSDELRQLLAVQQPDSERIRLIAHTLKGSAGFFGHLALANAAQELEAAVLNYSDLSGVGPRLLRAIDDILSR